jgi:hypothetical protein
LLIYKASITVEMLGSAERPAAVAVNTTDRPKPRKPEGVHMAVSTAAAKRRGVKLDGNRGAKLTLEARRAGVKPVQARVTARVLTLAPIVRELQAAGVTSLVGIAAAFNERSIPTATGRGTWHAVQVSRVLARITASVVFSPATA